MIRKTVIVGCMFISVLAGCATPTKDAIRDIGLGMSMNDVELALGQPKAHAEQGPYDAWRYEYRILGPSSCKNPFAAGGGSGTNPNCEQICEHATVWFNENEVRSITSIRVHTLGDCRLESTPIDWEHMPEYAKEPKI